MPEKPTVLIAGAGIGGLTAAACLLKSGYRVRVFEQAPRSGEIGAGIQMSANGVKVLWHLGLADELDRIGVRPNAYVFRLFQSGEILQSFPLGVEHYQRHGAPYYQFHRADIHALLVRTVQARDPDAIQFNCLVDGFGQTHGRVTVTLAGGRREVGDLLIGADGIKSVVRDQLLGQIEARYTGDAAWRVLVPRERLPDDFMDVVTTVWVAPGAHGVVYFLRGCQLINFVGLVEDPQWADESWTVTSDWSEMRDDFRGWHDDVCRIIDAADRNQCYRWGLFDRPTVDHWSQDHVTLLGDAAHAMLPYLAQGAVMAVEDAAVLTRCLNLFDSIEEAVDVYQKSRIPRTGRVLDESTANARLFHLESEESFRAAFRERTLGAERNQWLYSHDPWNVDLTL